ncbi:MAG: prepilin-type N-terminal cleavage/methylation domain-containing protein [Rhodanobacteraceae bacterium]
MKSSIVHGVIPRPAKAEPGIDSRACLMRAASTDCRPDREAFRVPRCARPEHGGAADPGFRPESGSRSQRGFTLIEVLVAMLLLSLLLAGAWGGIHTATRAIHSGDLAIERMNRLRVTEQFLRRQLSHSMPLAFGRDDATGMNYLFQGEPERMRFVAPMPGYLSKGGAYVQTLELSRAGQGMQLTFADQMLNGFKLEDADKDAAKPVLLIDGIARGHFQYRGLDDQGELDDWTDEWDDASRMPVMVRIAFEMTPESGMTWPTMDIPLMMDVGSLPRRARSRPVPGMTRNGQPAPDRQPRAPPSNGGKQ